MKQAAAAYPFSKAAVDRLALKLAEWAARATTRQCCVAREDASSELAPWPGASRWSLSPRLQESSPSLCDRCALDPSLTGEPARSTTAASRQQRISTSSPPCGGRAGAAGQRAAGSNIAATQRFDPRPPYACRHASCQAQQRQKWEAATTTTPAAQHARRTIATHPTGCTRPPCLPPREIPPASLPCLATTRTPISPGTIITLSAQS